MRRIAQKLKAKLQMDASRKGRCEQKRIVTPRAKRVLRKIVVESRRGSCADVQKKFAEAGCNVSRRTVRRNLYELGFKCRRPIKKPRLTPCMIKKRLNWANLHRNLKLEQWQRVIEIFLV